MDLAERWNESNRTAISVIWKQLTENVDNSFLYRTPGKSNILKLIF